MKEFEIGKNEAGQRLDKYLHKLLPQAPASFLHKMLRKKNIVLNDKKAAGCDRITVGDHIKLYLSDETFETFHSNDKEFAVSPKPSALLPEILYEDEDILIINKPAGMLSQKAKPDDISANEIILQYLLDSGSITKEALQTFRPSVCNRLDRNTSGILIAGKTLHGLQTMSRQLKDRSIAKYYRCIVEGNLTEPKHLKGWLCKDHKKNQVHIFPAKQPDSQYIETAYEPIQQYKGAALLEVHLITGRSHQIRAHLSSIGHAIIGDTKYGNPQINNQFRNQAAIKHQLLHAYRIRLNGRTEIIAPLPAEFQRVEDMLRKSPCP